ncbi:MAG: hypothetical protein K0Q72_2039 [Armatimonadetes bacterium]|jgi:hypothetical protein|nr:hypothetical protein [Armatimonadota bacterium]
MRYELMLLADPGTPREQMMRVLTGSPDIRPDGDGGNRFILKLGNLEALLEIGSKDPVGSLHMEFDTAAPPVMESMVRRALDLAAALDMRVEDVLWGREVSPASVPELRAHWETARPAAIPAGAAAAKPWWRFW